VFAILSINVQGILSNLAIDMGNTLTKVGVFKESHLVVTHTFSQFPLEKIIELSTNHQVKNIIFSSVAQAMDEEEKSVLEEQFNFFELTASTPLPIKNLYRTPETLGKDRLAAVVGAYGMFPQSFCLVVDAGTCTTYDFVRQDGAYLGGNIAPGLRMRLKAMHRFTARLPEADLKEELKDWVGRDTIDALQNGAQVGALLEVEGYIAYAASQFGVVNVIFTGGHADFFAKHLKRKIFVNQNLVLEGLNKILEYNVELL
jgi:type III pantothenate kinase